MKRSFPSLSAWLAGAAIITLIPALLGAQQNLTRDQVKTKFESANPTLNTAAPGFAPLRIFDRNQGEQHRALIDLTATGQLHPAGGREVIQ